ncbi:MAG: hypothetical protein K9W43_12135 [Candidatus Thorarchaeota archaeon]|nr:hypothetical protein [Candidatus Thorarchaeota archaeon]
MNSTNLEMAYEFFSKKGFAAGGILTVIILILQSQLGFPSIWQDNPAGYMTFVIVSAIIVGIASGSVLVYLIPPDQDVIGVAGLGSDSISQHIALFLVILALIQPEFSGFVLFFDYFGIDPFAPLWVLLAFAAPSAGFATAMYDRMGAIARDLREYFKDHTRLDLVTLDWLHQYGARTAIYRMGMLESAAAKIPGLVVRGHMIIRETKMFSVTE